MTRPSGSQPRAARVTRGLLDGPLELTLPGPAKRIASEAHWWYWLMAPYRHSRLPPTQRGLEVLLTLLVRDAPAWQRALDSPPHTAASPGPIQRPPGVTWFKPKRLPWPKSYGAHETRRGLLLPAGSRVRVTRRIPAGAELRFELSLLPQGLYAGPTDVRLTARPERGVPVVLLARRLGLDAAGWFHAFRVALGRFRDQRVTIELSVHKPPQGRRIPGLVFFGQPRVESPAPKERDAHPNLVVLLLDTVRRDALGCYGQRRVLTPHLDALAALGARFERSYANAPWTRPSILSLLSSRTPGAAGGTPTSFFPYPLDVALVRSGALGTLPHHLAGQGYLVRGLVQNYFAMPYERVGNDHGFASLAHVMLPGGPHRADNPTLSRAAARFLARVGPRRFFLFLHYESAHAPYHPPRVDVETLRRHLGPRARLGINDRYRGEVMALDRLVGQLRRALEASGQWERTVLVVTSDHGDVLDPAHCFMLPKLHYNTCYGHSPSPYEEVLRVPLILRGPGVPRGRTVTQITRHVDLVPTLLQLLRLPPLPGAQGRSVLAQLRGTAADEERDVYAVGRGGVFVLRRGRYKVLWRAPAARTRIVLDRPLKVIHELYDLQTDPQEHHNLAAKRPALLRTLRAALFARMARDRFANLPPHGPRPRVPRDAR